MPTPSPSLPQPPARSTDGTADPDAASEPRSPVTPSAVTPSAAHADWSDGIGGEGRDLPQSRGFLGRILTRFASAGNGGDDEAPDSMMEAATSAAAPSILNLRRKTVDDVAVTKADIVAVPVTVGLPELVEVFREHGYSRVPVYRGNLDQPLGLVHLKDLALKHGFAPKGAPRFALRPLLRPLLYVPGSMPIGALLQQMQLKRIHMALVIDEYGGTSGLVTFEDIIEQIVGEIEDEFDEDDSADNIHAVSSERWRIHAATEIKDINTFFGTEYSSEEADTIGGLVIQELGHLPVRGEKVVIGGLQFTVARADNRRLHTLMATKVK